MSLACFGWWWKHLRREQSFTLSLKKESKCVPLLT